MPSTNNLADYTATTDLKTIRAVGSCNFPHVIRFYAGLIDKVCIYLLFIHPIIFLNLNRKKVKLLFVWKHVIHQWKSFTQQCIK
jgi:hypothetical protein